MMSTKVSKRGKIDMELFAKQIDDLIDGTSSKSSSSTCLTNSSKRGKIDMELFAKQVDALIDGPSTSGTVFPAVQKDRDLCKKDVQIKSEAKPAFKGKIDLNAFYRDLEAHQAFFE